MKWFRDLSSSFLGLCHLPQFQNLLQIPLHQPERQRKRRMGRIRGQAWKQHCHFHLLSVGQNSWSQVPPREPGKCTLTLCTRRKETGLMTVSTTMSLTWQTYIHIYIRAYTEKKSKESDWSWMCLGKRTFFSVTIFLIYTYMLIFFRFFILLSLKTSFQELYPALLRIHRNKHDDTQLVGM